MVSFSVLPATLAELEEAVRENKFGRWIRCKYCYKSVLPEVDYWEGLILCSQCGYGLVPLGEVLELIFREEEEHETDDSDGSD